MTDMRRANDVDHDFIRKAVEKINTTLVDHNGRLRKSELWQNRMIGGMVVVSILVGSVVIPAVYEFIKNGLLN